MPYDVTFANGRVVTVYNTEFMNTEQVRERAISQYQRRSYHYCPELKRCRWFEEAVPAIVNIQRVVEIYVNGGYCLVPN